MRRTGDCLKQEALLMESQFERLASEIQSCNRCDLSVLDINKKYGKLTMTGHVTNAILFVGQNPSCYRNSYSTGAFVGRTSGDFFLNLLKEADLLDKCSVTNLIKCFAHPHVKVYTSRGWRNISDVKEGDLVLTHKRRFRKVIRVMKKSGYKGKVLVIKLAYPSTWQRSGIFDKFRNITLEHPILTTRGWVLAKEIKIGDKITVLATKCTYCGKIFFNPNLYDNEITFCSNSCHMRYHLENDETFRYRLTKKANETVRNLVKEGKCRLQNRTWSHPFKGKTKENCEPLKRIGEATKRRLQEKPELRRKLVEAGTKALRKYKEDNPDWFVSFPRKRSKLEILFEEYLKEAKIPYRPQVKIGRCLVDFLIGSNIIIECDGFPHKHWQTVKERDRQKTEYLKEKGYDVLRYTDTEIYVNKDKIIQEIQRVMKNHEGYYKFLELKVISIEEKKYAKSRNLYNLEVEEDNSYVANKVVVHNCSTEKNAIPSAKVLETCIYWFNKEVELVNPKLIVGLGLFVKKFFNGVQNELVDWRGYKVFCTYHPAYVKNYGNINEFRRILKRIKEIYESTKYTQVRLPVCLS
jgi:uracil-DNA glycosylase/very-short-patch-repair endonuclease